MFTEAYRRYALLALTTVYTLSFMDRSLVGLLMQSIKEELLLSDTQLGFLTGIAFALFYATLGIPIARWADRGNRVTIISLAMGIWGGMVMLCGAVTSFVQLVLVRVGAAVGEAGCLPPSYSLISDYFPLEGRTRALSVFMMGISFNVIISFIFAGWVDEHYGWRAAFLIVGLPGLVMAVLIKLTLREPRVSSKLHVNKAPVKITQQPPLGDVFISLWKQNTYRYLLIAVTLANFVGIGLSQWYPSFFIRTHGMSTGELGVWLGLAGGIAGAVGTYLGGYIVNRYFSTDACAQLRFIAFGIALIWPVTLCMLLSAYKEVALIMLIPVYALNLFLYGPFLALIQLLVDEKIRAVAVAINMLVLNLIGMGLGPQSVGILSDILNSYLGVDSLRVAMALASTAVIGSAYYFCRASQTIENDLAHCQCEQARESADTFNPDAPKSPATY